MSKNSAKTIANELVNKLNNNCKIYYELDDDFIIVSLARGDIHITIDTNDDEDISLTISELNKTSFYKYFDINTLYYDIIKFNEQYDYYTEFIIDTYNEYQNKNHETFDFIKDERLNIFIKSGDNIVCVTPDFNHNCLNEIVLHISNKTGVKCVRHFSDCDFDVFSETLSFFLK